MSEEPMHPTAVALTSSGPGNVLQSILDKLGLDALPPHPVWEKNAISIHFDTLQCDPAQLDMIKETYAKSRHFHRVFTGSAVSQQEARDCLREQGLVFDEMDDLANGWSKRWSTSTQSKGIVIKRVLFQCQSGSSTTARQKKYECKKFEYGKIQQTKPWKRKMPYDFTGCLGHLDLTYSLEDSKICRITGILEHDEDCKFRQMRRLPPVPVHPHVWQEALEQINNGSNMTAVQTRNRELYEAKFYQGQKDEHPENANYRYLLLKGDSRSLYRKQALSLGVDFQKDAAENIDNWLQPDSLLYRPELASAIFLYQGRVTRRERFILCIQTQYMKSAAWEYAHGKQLMLDGTFGICDRRVLLFIALGVDTQNRGTPLAFFLFSAPTGNQATHAGYDMSILTDVLKPWVKYMGEYQGQTFAPKVVITDTDMREHGALLSIWPNVTLLLCKFHTRQCWTNRRKTDIKMGQTDDFYKDQITKRLQNLEQALIDSDNRNAAIALVNAEETWFEALSTNICISRSTLTGVFSYLGYLTNYWLTPSMWESWSAFGRKAASDCLGIPLEGVIPTTNHLESFNGILKHKYLHQYQKGGRRIRLDLLVMLLTTYILPSIYTQRSAENEYYNWLSTRFGSHIHDPEIIEAKRSKASTVQAMPERLYAVTWWSPELQIKSHDSAQSILKQGRITDLKWVDSHTVEATCASSLANIEVEGHVRYCLSLNAYGLGACTCPFNSMGNGACKHLWAFRYLLPSLSPPIMFYFPLTENTALEIYRLFFPDNSQDTLGATSSQKTVGTTSNISRMPTLPAPSTNHLLNMAKVANTLSSAIFDSESDSDAPDTEHDDSKSDEVCIGLDSASALKEQMHARINHELTTLIPRLHGLFRMLNDGKDILTDVPQIMELTGIIKELSGILPETDTDNGPGTSTNNIITSKARKRLPTYKSGRRQVLLPSPERKQKRKRSTAIF